MSKSVKIPETANPWRCVINGVEYAYTPGSTQTVPDEVAALIAQIEEYPPDPLPVEKPWPCGIEPEITDPQDGDVLVYDATAGVWKNGEGGSGGGVTVVHSTEDEGGNITLDMKAGALYAACEQGPVFIQGLGSWTLMDVFYYDESLGYTFNRDYTAQTADDYPVEQGLH